MGEIGAFVLVAAAEEGRGCGGGGGVGARGEGFAPGEAEFDFELIFTAVMTKLVCFWKVDGGTGEAHLRLHVTKLGMMVFGKGWLHQMSFGRTTSVPTGSPSLETGMLSPCRDTITHRLVSVLIRS